MAAGANSAAGICYYIRATHSVVFGAAVAGKPVPIHQYECFCHGTLPPPPPPGTCGTDYCNCALTGAEEGGYAVCPGRVRLRHAPRPLPLELEQRVYQQRVWAGALRGQLRGAQCKRVVFTRDGVARGWWHGLRDQCARRRTSARPCIRPARRRRHARRLVVRKSG